LTRSTQKSLFSLWQVTCSTRPANASYPDTLRKRITKDVSGLPDRRRQKDSAAAPALAGRTLIALCNERPTWLT